MRVSLASAVLLCAIAAAGRARAGDEGAASPGDDIEDVLVEGETSGGFVSTAKVGETTREVTDAASLVEPLPGVHVRRLGADDSFATMSIRGASSLQTQVYLAGVPLTGGADPGLDLATLPLWPNATVRVYRSFAPAALGRGSLGGTLALDPPSPRAKAASDVWTGVGSFGAARMRAGDVRGASGGVRVATGLSASRSDGAFEYVDPLASAAGPEVTARRENAGHAAIAAMASVTAPARWTPAARGAVTFTTLAQARRQELPGTVKAPTPYHELRSSRLVSAVTLTGPAAEGAWTARAWGRREGLALRDAPASASATLGPSRTDDAIVAAGGSLGVRTHGGRWSSVEVRVDGSGERFAPGAWEGAPAPPSARRSNLGLAVDAELHATRTLTASLSGRLDTWTDAASGRSDGTLQPTAHAGLEQMWRSARLATHAGLVARPPSFVERYGNRGAFLGDPTLSTERAFTVDAGGAITRRAGPVRLEIEGALFATWARDLITFVAQGAYGRARATNIGEAFVAGSEAQAKVSLPAGLALNASYTFLLTENRAACAVAVGDCERPPLAGRPTHDVVLDATFTAGSVRLRYGLDVVAGMTSDLGGATRVPDRALHGAGVRWGVPWAPGLTLAADVRNLFDLRAVSYAGVLGPVRAPIGDAFEYPLPGRNVLFTARYATTAL